MFEKQPEDPDNLDETQGQAEGGAEEERAKRVARVIERVRSGTYQVRSDVVATRLLETMLRRPKK